LWLCQLVVNLHFIVMYEDWRTKKRHILSLIQEDEVSQFSM